MSEIYSTQRPKGGGIGAAVGESRTIPRYFCCSQSRTFPLYIALWQLHSYLYLENSRVFWDSVVWDEICFFLANINGVKGALVLCAVTSKILFSTIHRRLTLTKNVSIFCLSLHQSVGPINIKC